MSGGSSLRNEVSTRRSPPSTVGHQLSTGDREAGGYYLMTSYLQRRIPILLAQRKIIYVLVARRIW